MMLLIFEFVWLKQDRDFLDILSTVISIVVIIFTAFTIHEMRNARRATYKPELVFSSFDYFVKAQFTGGPYLKFNTLKGNENLKEDYRGLKLEIINIGKGAAINVSFLESIDFAKLIDDYYTQFINYKELIVLNFKESNVSFLNPIQLSRTGYNKYYEFAFYEKSFDNIVQLPDNKDTKLVELSRNFNMISHAVIANIIFSTSKESLKFAKSIYYLPDCAIFKLKYFDIDNNPFENRFRINIHVESLDNYEFKVNFSFSRIL